MALVSEIPRPICSACPQCGGRFAVMTDICPNCRLRPHPGAPGQRIHLWLLVRTPRGVQWIPPNGLNKTARAA